MDRWRGRVALVTGASAGIGKAIVKDLVLQGMIVVGVARRVDRVVALKAELEDASGTLYPVACDITQEFAILETFEWVAKTFGGVDVLINNAGVLYDSTLSDSSTEIWKNILDVNILGLSICTREAVKSMKARGVDDGHIININSIDLWRNPVVRVVPSFGRDVKSVVPLVLFDRSRLRAGTVFPHIPSSQSVCGHKVVTSLPLTMYCASKYAVTALTEGLRAELLGTNIKSTSVSPGVVRTEIFSAGNIAGAEAIFEQMPSLEAKDISDAVLYVLGTPPNVQVTELTITPCGVSY